MRLFFTCVSGLLVATAGALWWVQGPRPAAAVAPAAAPALEERSSEEVSGSPQLPDTPDTPEVAHAGVAKAPAAVEEPDTREEPQAIEPSPASVEAVVELPDPGDFVVDTGPTGADTAPSMRPNGEPQGDPPLVPSSSEEVSIVHVDPERSAGWVERLLALYEVVRE
jgi:hypothetical protein